MDHKSQITSNFQTIGAAWKCMGVKGEYIKFKLNDNYEIPKDKPIFLFSNKSMVDDKSPAYQVVVGK